MWRSILLVVLLAFVGTVAACEGPVGPAGETGSGEAGRPGPSGPPSSSSGTADGAAPPTGVAGEGLRLDVLGAKIGGDRSLTVTFRVSDGPGAPLDREGQRTAGAVTARFVVAALDVDAAGAPAQYVAYTTKSNTSPTTAATEIQADADQGGLFTEIDAATGTYAYRFGTLLPAGFDPKKTHSIGVWAWRDFASRRYVANTVFHFVPAGGGPVTREIVKTQACNACHNPMSHHEGDVARRETSLCILCHAGSMRDPDSGNALDFRVMIHKMHRGKLLPSVAAGKPYELFDEAHEAGDFSTVVFPQDIRRCGACHTGAQGDTWRTRPSRAACGACHDLTSFTNPPPAGMTAHQGGVQYDDSKCASCHPASGGLVGISEVHLTPAIDPSSPVLTLTIARVDSTAPSLTPVLHFVVKLKGQGLDILASPMASLAVTLAGPTTDFATFTQYVIQGPGAAGTLVADGAPGAYAYTFPAPMAAGAAGTYAVGMEGSVTSSDPKVRFSALNPVAYVAVTDPKPSPRRDVVARAQCNSCHYDLSAHGGIRRSPEYCVLCHGGNEVNDEQVARFQGSTVVARPMHFKVLIHQIHRGRELTQQPRTLGGSPAPTPQNPGGTPIDLGAVRYPGDQRACWACHTGTSYFLPLPDGLLPTKTETLACTDPPPIDPAAWCNARIVSSVTATPPAAAACTACHDTQDTAAHAQAMTTSAGVESCGTCHGVGKPWSVQGVHALPP